MLDVKYDWLFGKLEPGRYEIIKKVDDFRGTGDFDTYEYHAEFMVWGDGYVTDYGESSIYSRQDMDEAITVILDYFKTFEESGCVLHSIRYAGDSCSGGENIGWMNDLSKDGTVYTQCIEFLSDYHSPKEDAGAWNPDSEYTDWEC